MSQSESNEKERARDEIVTAAREVVRYRNCSIGDLMERISALSDAVLQGEDVGLFGEET